MVEVCQWKAGDLEKSYLRAWMAQFLVAASAVQKWRL